MRGHEHELLASTTPTPPSGTPPSTSRCSATGRSTTTAGPRSPSTRTRGSARPTASTTTCGSSTTSRRTGRSPTTSPPSSPSKLAELQRLFLIQAARFNVLPLDTRSAERFNPDLVGRPSCITGNSQTLYPGMKRLSENTVDQHQEQVVHGDRRRSPCPMAAPKASSSPRAAPTAAGRVYATDGRLDLRYNVLGIETLHDRSPTRRCRRRPARCASHFAYDGGGLGKGGTVTLFAGDDQDRRGPGRAHAAVPVLLRRDRRRRQRPRARRCPTTTAPTGNEFTGTHRLGADRPRRRQPRPPHRPGAPDAGRDAQAVTTRRS